MNMCEWIFVNYLCECVCTGQKQSHLGAATFIEGALMKLLRLCIPTVKISSLTKRVEANTLKLVAPQITRTAQ